MMIGFRVVMGLGVGFSSVAGPTSRRSRHPGPGGDGQLYQLAITIGIFLAMLLDTGSPLRLVASFLRTGSSHGRWSDPRDAGMPPSPRWLVGKGRDAVALGVLKRTMGSIPAAEEELEAIKVKVEEEKGTSFLKALASGRALKVALVLAIGLAFLQQASGINAIFYYAPEIISEIGLNDWKFQLTAALSLINVLATFIAIFLVDRLDAGLADRGNRTHDGLADHGGRGQHLAAEGDRGRGGGLGRIHGRHHHADRDLHLGDRLACSLGPLVWLVISEIFRRGAQCLRGRDVGQLGRELLHRPGDHPGQHQPRLALDLRLQPDHDHLRLVPEFETKGVELEKIEDFFKGKQARQGWSRSTSGVRVRVKNGFPGRKGRKSGGKCPMPRRYSPYHQGTSRPTG